MDPVIGCIICCPFLILLFLRYYITKGQPCTSKNTLEGKTVIITGATSGIGKATALLCAKRGGKVILACRDKTKAEGVVAQIRRKIGSQDIFFLPLDLQSLCSVREFVDIFIAQHGKTDILINNAAYMGPKQTTLDGFDLAFTVNYLGPFLLTNLIIQKLTPSKENPLRVINVCSDSYKQANLDFDDLMMVRVRGNFDIHENYARSKLALLLFNLELCYRYMDRHILTIGVHPGAVNTNLLGNWPGKFGQLLRMAARLLFRSPDSGAQGILYSAVADDVDQYGGKLLFDCKSMEVLPHGRDFKAAERLWNISLNLSGLE